PDHRAAEYMTHTGRSRAAQRRACRIDGAPFALCANQRFSFDPEPRCPAGVSLAGESVGVEPTGTQTPENGRESVVVAALLQGSRPPMLPEPSKGAPTRRRRRHNP